MKFNKSSDFIDAINSNIKDEKDIQIKLDPKKYAFFEELIRWGEWNGKHFEISGTIFLKRAEVEWEEDLDSLIEQLEGIEISELGNDFYGWNLLGDDGGYPEANEDGIKWFSSDRKEIKLNDKELKEFEEIGIDELWDQAGFDNEESLEMMMAEGGMWKIIVTIGDKNFALISEEYFEQCDDEGNIQYNHTKSTNNERIREDGDHKSYYDNGQIEAQIEYKSGKMNGQATGYFETGELQSEGIFKDDKREGVWKGYHKNGKLRKMCEFKNGEVSSLVEEWDENGNKIIIEVDSVADDKVSNKELPKG